ncbi:hypothetical protein FRX31_030410 [Thalictrum thalictroides]|uniref:Uncharacterized protein n=1 Tax=Thalictrum thalictroides TaxID=46969 RepID=A0A7J6V510_THATH|nr:hypothetical protein FRX31_030410 [Thalictrum thalictroides]
MLEVAVYDWGVDQLDRIKVKLGQTTPSVEEDTMRWNLSNGGNFTSMNSDRREIEKNGNSTCKHMLTLQRRRGNYKSLVLILSICAEVMDMFYGIATHHSRIEEAMSIRRWL